MSDELDPSQELTSWEEVSYSNMVQNEAGQHVVTSTYVFKLIKKEEDGYAL